MPSWAEIQTSSVWLLKEQERNIKHRRSRNLLFLRSVCRNLSGVSFCCQTVEVLCGSKRKSLLFDSALRTNTDIYHWCWKLLQTGSLPCLVCRYSVSLLVFHGPATDCPARIFWPTRVRWQRGWWRMMCLLTLAVGQQPHWGGNTWTPPSPHRLLFQ